MKPVFLVALALLLSACSSTSRSGAGAAPGRGVNRPAYEVRGVLRALNEALEESERLRPEGFPELKHVEVRLEARTEIDAGGEVKFLLVSGGVDTSSSHSTSLTLNLEAPKSPSGSSVEQRRAKPRSPIAQAILAAKRAYIGERGVTGGPLEQFERGDITVEIAFEISDKASAGIESGDLLPVGLSANAGASLGKTHTVKLVYGK
jgi:hypothetical protein